MNYQILGYLATLGVLCIFGCVFFYNSIDEIKRIIEKDDF